MPSYSHEIIEEVRNANDIVDVVGHYVSLKGAGNSYKGLCPFHGEKTPSFHVNRSMQIFKCFGCGEAGNVFSFIMKSENINFPEAVQMLAERANINLPEPEMNENDKKRARLLRELGEINKDAATFFYYKLRSDEGSQAYEYLRNRGLSDETINKFGLGFAGKFSDGLYKTLKKKGYSDDIIKVSGLVTITEKGAYDKFWNRVMFPIMDNSNKVIAFGGRIMVKSENAPKYLNSPETEVFSKSNNLYAQQIVRKTKRDFVLLCEGYMDVIALHQAGMDNAVASLGTALTAKQAQKIAKYANTCVITYDSDGAGVKAALRAIPILKNAGLSVKILNMSPYKDPDEFIKAIGLAEYEKRIEEAVSGFDFEALQLEKAHNFEDPDDKTRFDHEIAATIAGIEDPMARHNHIEAAAKKYNIEPEMLKRAVNEIGLKRQQQEAMEEMRQQQKATAALKPEQGAERGRYQLLSMIAANEAIYRAIGDNITEEDFADQLERRVFRYIKEEYSEKGSAVGARIADKFETPEEQAKVADILMTSIDEENMSDDERRKAFADLVVNVKKAIISVKMDEALAANDAVKLQELMQEDRKLKDLHGRIMKTVG